MATNGEGNMAETYQYLAVPRVKVDLIGDWSRIRLEAKQKLNRYSATTGVQPHLFLNQDCGVAGMGVCVSR